MLPGRTDSEIKNHWHAYLSKKIHAQPESSPSVLKHHQPNFEDKNSKQNFEDNIMGSSDSINHNTHNWIYPEDSFQIEYDNAFLDDFLLDVFQNDQIGDDWMNLKIPEIEDQNMVGSSSSSSSSIDYQYHRSSKHVLDFWSSSTGFPSFDY